MPSNKRAVIDGTPRDCATPGCGAEADTSIIRQNELGSNKASALGRTNGGGPVDAAAAISTFMTGSAGGSTTGKRGLLGNLLGGGMSMLRRYIFPTLTLMQVIPKLVRGLTRKALRPKMRLSKVVSRLLQALVLQVACLRVPTTEPSA